MEANNKKTIDSHSKPVYFNTPQRLNQLIGANISVIVAGRRTGKTCIPPVTPTKEEDPLPNPLPLGRGSR